MICSLSDLSDRFATYGDTIFKQNFYFWQGERITFYSVRLLDISDTKSLSQIL